MIKKKRKFLYANMFSIVLAHILAGFSVWYAIAHGFSAGNWIFFGVLCILTGFGITVGYHRMLTHRAFQCGGVLRWIFSILGGMAGQGYEYEWVANHRVHHYFADLESDPHSPLAYPGLKGLLWAHVFWLFFDYQRPSQYKTFRDLERDPVVQWQKRFYLPIVLLGFAVPFIFFGFQGILLAGFLRLVVVWHSTWSVNSICHLFGARAKDLDGQVYTRDDSRNNIFVAFFALGEGYHANHHVQPALAYHGWEWYNLDASKWLIGIFESVGLVWNVKKLIKRKYYQTAELQQIA